MYRLKHTETRWYKSFTCSGMYILPYLLGKIHTCSVSYLLWLSSFAVASESIERTIIQGKQNVGVFGAPVAETTVTHPPEHHHHHLAFTNVNGGVPAHTADQMTLSFFFLPKYTWKRNRTKDFKEDLKQQESSGHNLNKQWHCGLAESPNRELFLARRWHGGLVLWIKWLSHSTWFLC